MADGTTYIVDLPGNLKLHVEMKGRPVDFKIVFTGSGEVTFHRGEDALAEHKIEVSGELNEVKSASGGETRHHITRKSAIATADAAEGDDSWIEYSDPGMGG